MGAHGLPTRVLLIDDEEDEFCVIRDLLSEVPAQEFELEQVMDFDSALHALSGGSFDICMLDCCFGQKNGLELLQEISQSTCQTPVILLTGRGNHGVDPAAQKIDGLSLDQMQGRTWLDPRWRAIREDGRKFSGEMHPSMVALRTVSEVLNMEMGVYPQYGNYRWTNVNAVPQFHSWPSSPCQVYSILEDITERKEKP